MKKADRITAVVLLAVAGFVFYQSWLLPPSLTFGPGPAFLPAWLAVLLAILSIILFVASLKPAALAQESSPWPGRRELTAVGLVLGGLFVFALALEIAGFIISTFIFVLYLMRMTQKETWSKATLVALGTMGGLFIVFQVLLGISLPKNWLGF
jgi:hypothetical protein